MRYADFSDMRTAILTDPAQIGTTFTETTGDNFLRSTSIAIPTTGWVRLVIACQASFQDVGSHYIPASLLTGLTAALVGDTPNTAGSTLELRCGASNAYVGRTSANVLLFDCSGGDPGRIAAYDR